MRGWREHLGPVEIKIFLSMHGCCGWIPFARTPINTGVSGQETGVSGPQRQSQAAFCGSVPLAGATRLPQYLSVGERFKVRWGKKELSLTYFY